MQPSLLISAEWMIDGTGRPYQKNVLIEIQGPTIQSVSVPPASGPEISAIPPSKIIDLKGCTVLPGLIDSHVHLPMSGKEDAAYREKQLSSGFKETCGRIQRHLKDHSGFGIIGVRDGGDRYGYTLRFRDSAGEGTGLPVTVMFAGRAWHAEGRYGRLIGRPPGPGTSLAESISASDENIDVVKVVNSGLNSLRAFGKQTRPQFSPEELRQGAAAAHRLGRKVMVHANGQAPVSIAIDAGCDSIEHGFFMGRDNLQKMAEKNVFWVPTAVTMKAYARVMTSNPEASAGAQKNLDHQLEQLQLARKYGVKAVVGTDAGSPGVYHGRAVREEIGLFMNAGYPVEEAIRCASSMGAELLGLPRTGTIEKGMNASFIVVPGPPSGLPESLGSIERIYLNGRIRKRDERNP